MVVVTAVQALVDGTAHGYAAGGWAGRSALVLLVGLLAWAAYARRQRVVAGPAAALSAAADAPAPAPARARRARRTGAASWSVPSGAACVDVLPGRR